MNVTMCKMLVTETCGDDQVDVADIRIEAGQDYIYLEQEDMADDITHCILIPRAQAPLFVQMLYTAMMEQSEGGDAE